MTILTPKLITGLPSGVKARPRADFIPEEFDQLHITKGYRLYWSRAGICPCLNNDQTEQSDPTCRLCGGDAYYFFLPDEAVSAGATQDVHGNPINLNTDGDGVMIQAIMTSMTQDVQVFEKFGEWVFGTSRITTQAENKLGYRDRLVAVDSVMSWAQVIEYAGGQTIVVTGERKKSGLRYPAVSVNQFRSLSTVFREGTDFYLTSSGTLQWIGTPPVEAGERLTLHYEIHPVWRVMDHMHTHRDTFTEDGKTTEGEFRKMPVQVVAKLDFLINPS